MRYYEVKIKFAENPDYCLVRHYRLDGDFTELEPEELLYYYDHACDMGAVDGYYDCVKALGESWDCDPDDLIGADEQIFYEEVYDLYYDHVMFNTHYTITEITPEQYVLGGVKGHALKLRIFQLKTRIDQLATRPYDNSAIINKLKRKIWALYQQAYDSGLEFMASTEL